MSGRPGSFCALVLVSLCAAAPSLASSNGIVGFSGNPATQGGDNCNVCHSGGVVPTVVLNGPTTVKAGSTRIYALTVVSGTMAQDYAGFDVSATDGVLAAFEAGTRTGTNPIGQEEVTQSATKKATGGQTIFQFNWTAPLTTGTVTLYGAGNSVDNAQGFNGDAASTDTLTVTVEGGGSTPGETSGPALQPLLVDDYDVATGNLSLAYDSGCGATDNTIHYGPLSQVSTHGWSGSDCAIDSGGNYTTFNPGVGSYFFIVVGNDGTAEGSYGRTNPTGGPVEERPDYAGNACGQSQDLSNTCAEP